MKVEKGSLHSNKDAGNEGRKCGLRPHPHKGPYRFYAAAARRRRQHRGYAPSVSRHRCKRRATPNEKFGPPNDRTRQDYKRKFRDRNASARRIREDSDMRHASSRVLRMSSALEAFAARGGWQQFRFSSTRGRDGTKPADHERLLHFRNGAEIVRGCPAERMTHRGEPAIVINTVRAPRETRRR